MRVKGLAELSWKKSDLVKLQAHKIMSLLSKLLFWGYFADGVVLIDPEFVKDGKKGIKKLCLSWIMSEA